MMKKAENLIAHLNELLKLLEPLHDLANSHFGSFFSENLWYDKIPQKIQMELNSDHSINKFIELYPKIMKGDCPIDFAQNHPELMLFLQNAAKVSLANNKNYSDLSWDAENLILSKDPFANCDIRLEGFMSSKKLHEVKNLCQITSSLSNLTESSHIVDIGGGKGYLSSVLALQLSYKVLSIDSSEIITCGALKRSEKVASLWKGGIFDKDGNSKNIFNKLHKQEVMKKYYKQVTTFVSPHTNIKSILSENFEDDVKGITLTGLHTCGDLASTCLKLFLHNTSIRGIVNVGCCYNHINEEFDHNNSVNKTNIKNNFENFGFPMSNFLKTKNFALGRNARMLAAHSLERINLTSVLDEFSLKSLLYRAILEAFLKNYVGITSDRPHTGRLGKKCKNFYEYMHEALKILDINIQVSESDLNKVYDLYCNKQSILTAYFLLRITLAPVIESIILLDRILYLIENGINNAYLVQLFDLKISPRGFAVVAWKDLKNCQ